MAGSHMRKLKEQYAFEEWGGRSTLGRGLFIWRFGLADGDLPGWIPQRVQVIEPPGMPRVLRSVWSPEAGGTGALLAVDIYEADSREAAHELILQLLANSQAPTVERTAEAPVGDVTFRDPSGAMVIFARANLVVMVRKAGQLTVPVEETARALDATLVGGTGRAGAASDAASPADPAPVALGTSGPGETVPLRLDAPAGAGGAGPASWYRIHADGGEVVRQDGELLFRPTDAEAQELVVEEVRAGRAVATRTLRPDLRDPT
jgi:hypothetical protein